MKYRPYKTFKKSAKKRWTTALVVTGFVVAAGAIVFLSHKLGYLQPAEDWVTGAWETFKNWITGSGA